MKSFAFRRPDCVPEGGLVIAKNYKQALDLVAAAYGSGWEQVYDPQTKKWYDEDGEMKKQ